MTQPLVAIRSVSKNFGEFQALDRASLGVRAGEGPCLIGASGSGKTTLLRCIKQLTSIDRGGIWLDGELLGVREEGGRLHRLTERQIARQRLKTGMVFQRFNLFPHKPRLKISPKVRCRCRAAAVKTRRPRRRSFSGASGLWRKPMPIPHSFQADSSSAWQLPARSP